MEAGKILFFHQQLLAASVHLVDRSIPQPRGKQWEATATFGAASPPCAVKKW